MARAAEIEAQAADWLAKRESDAWAAEDQRALDAWIASATEHRVAFLRLEAALARVDRLRALPISGRTSVGKPFPWRTAIAAAIASLVLGGAGIFAAMRGDNYETAIGGHQTIPLADGSRVELDTNSRVQVRFSEQRREVTLARGQAYFEVAHDEARPFVVTAGDERIVVVGTKFSVLREGDRVRVLVTEGRVRVEHNDQSAPHVLTPGAIAYVDGPDALLTEASAQTLADTLSWRSGFLAFRDATLGAAVADFNRYNEVQIVVVDAELNSIPIGGRFRPANVDAFVRLLEAGFPIRAERRGDQILLHAA